ncbi:hypothetical protein [Mammaliicoccus sciuri]|uniref:hypothetical protein n=1 Tax=Mammaliicoccus sciuri TaxID=1296 RepID=UPI0034DD2CB5
MKLLKYTNTHIYILTDGGHQLKLINPGHKRKSEVYKSLRWSASDYDKMIKDENKKA